MPHLWIHADLLPDTTLQEHLAAWGWTYAAAADARQANADGPRPDAVLAADPRACAGASAPLVIVSARDPRLTGAVWLQDYGRQGQRLKGALQACLAMGAAQAPAADDLDAAAALQVDLLDYLGHELRTPLAAIRTALEILADDLGRSPALPAAGEPDARAKMIELALRNVQRLDRTVDWGQMMIRSGAERPETSVPDSLAVPC